MTTADRLQKQRFELKYLVSESKAQAIRFFCRNYLELDTYGATQPNHSYPVHSLYLDSPGYKTYQDTINGSRNRYKLRLRFYEKEGVESVYFEIKRRYNRVIAKKRAEVKGHSVQPIVMGRIPVIGDLTCPAEDQFRALTDFSRLVNSINARPVVHVTYMREAWELKNSNAVRITFDRNVNTERVKKCNIHYDMIRPVSVFGNHVVVELKFTDRFPAWMKELVQKFGLRQQSAAKYVDGLNRIKDKQLLTV